MTDRELLELAAKAAGIELRRVELHGDDFWHGRTLEGGVWTPLHDDGDALRLAVNLGLAIHQHMKVGECEVEAYDGPAFACAWHGSDPLAATRRAIVRTAAEIGRAMP